MKTSNVLLISLISLVFIAMIGVNVSIKAELNEIDLDDQFSGYSRHVLKPFKHIKLAGHPFGSIQIQPGETFEIRKEKTDQLGQSMILEWRQSGDTLMMTQQMQAGAREIPYTPDGYVFRKPHLYIIAPTVSSLSSQGITSRVSHWPSGKFSIVQIGKALLISDNRFDEIVIDAAQESYVAIDEKNRLGSTTVILRDSSELAVEKDVFKNFSLQADSATHVDLPGGLLRRILDFRADPRF